jgi:hypothetical protein
MAPLVGGATVDAPVIFSTRGRDALATVAEVSHDLTMKAPDALQDHLENWFSCRSNDVLRSFARRLEARKSILAERGLAGAKPREP